MMMGPLTQMVYLKTPDQEFWEAIFQELVANAHDPEDAAKYADEAIEQWRKRWPHKQIATPPAFHTRPLALDRLMEAQKSLEAARDQLKALRNLADQMPKDLGEAYYGVAGPMAEKQVEYCEQWVKNIQAEMERADPPRAPGAAQ